MPKEPTITIYETEDGEWIAAMSLPNCPEGTIIDIGAKHEVHETVNKLLDKLNLIPERL